MKALHCKDSNNFLTIIAFCEFILHFSMLLPTKMPLLRTFQPKSLSMSCCFNMATTGLPSGA